MNILILGGSKFMGLLTVSKLIKLKENKNINLFLHIINRGKVYWDGEFYKIIENKDYIFHHKVDRENESELSELLKKLKNTYFDNIIDFTLYEPKRVIFILEKLEYNFKNYIFISTDSTYNASEISLKKDFNYFKNSKLVLIKEEDSTDNLNDIDKDIKSKLKKRDKYGYNKLKCEIELKKIFKDNNLIEKGKNYIILRLPDVIGEFDESYRLWYYIIWLKYTEIKPIEFEEIDLFRKLSFVLRDDIVHVIVELILNNAKEWNQEYNLACEENITLKELIDYISSKLNIKDYKYIISDSYAHTYYPSVTIGPISIEKAKQMLNFTPTSLFKSIDISLEFFYNIENGQKYKKEFSKMVQDLPKEIKNIIKKE